MGVLGAATAVAEPAPAPLLPGMRVVVHDVLGPQDPGFWDPAVPGTRVWEPMRPGVWVTCSWGFVPVSSCSTHDRWAGMISRDLLPVDVPVPGGPLRVWFDRPQATDVIQWNNGSVGELIMRFYTR